MSQAETNAHNREMIDGLLALSKGSDAEISLLNAKLRALLEIVSEIAEKFGVEETRFQKVFDEKTAWHSHRQSTAIEDADPALAARLEERTDEEMLQIPDECPQLFEGE